MASPDDRRYLQTHEWHKLEGNIVTIGISKFAVDELTDLTFVEITQTEGQVNAGGALGEIESVKATSDVYTGVSGTVVEVNQRAMDDPSLVNRDPYEAGWLVKIEADDTSQLDGLMSAEQYDHAIA